MSVRQDEVQIRVNVLGNEAQASYAKLEKGISDLEGELKNLTKGTEEYNKKAAEIEQAKTQMGNFRKEVDLNKLSSQQLLKLQKDLQREAKLAYGTEKFKELKPELDRVNAKVKEMNTELRGVTQTSGGMFDSMMQMTPFAGHFNAMKGGLMGVQKGTMAASSGFKTLKGAIISTGIGALVVLLGALISYFTGTQEGVDKVTAVLRPLEVMFKKIIGVLQEMIGNWLKKFSKAWDDPKAAMMSFVKMLQDQVMNRIKAFGVIWQGVQKLLKGDTSGFKAIADGFLQAGTGIEGMTDKIKNGANNLKSFVQDSVAQGKQLDLMIKRIEQAEISLNKNRQTLNEEYERQNEIARDSEKSEKERAIALKAAQNALAQLTKMEKDFIDLKINRIKLEHELNGNLNKDYKELNDLEAEKLAFEAAASAKRVGLKKLENKISKEMAAEEAEREKEKQDKAEELRKRDEAAARSIQALKIELMDEGLVKELAKIDIEYAEKLKAIEGNETQMAEQLALIEAQKIRDIAEARRLEDENIRLEDEEIQKAILEQKFLNVLMTEQEYQDALYEQQRENMQRSLDLIREMHGEENLEYVKKYNEILKLDKDHSDKKLDNAKKTAELKASIEDAEFEASKDIMNLGLELLSADEAGRKKHGDAIRAFSAANVAVDFVEEIQSIWKNAEKNPANALFPGAAQGIAIVKTIAAGVRKGIAISKIMGQKFAMGGIFGGSSHAQGGNAVIDSRTGNKVAEVEAGEPYMILSKSTYGNNRKIIDQLLYSSMYKNGAPIFETGGVVNPYRSSPSTASTAVSTSVTTNSVADQAAAQTSEDMRQYMLLVANEVRALHNSLLSGSIPAKLVYSEFESVQKEITAVRGDAAL
jgi:hypothetical protein